MAAQFKESGKKNEYDAEAFFLAKGT